MHIGDPSHLIYDISSSNPVLKYAAELLACVILLQILDIEVNIFNHSILTDNFLAAGWNGGFDTSGVPMI